jgi:esterase/lipase
MKIAKFLPLNLILKYTFNTNEFIKNCRMPVLIFHGNKDEEIHHSSSIKLKEDFKSEDRLIIFESENHSAISDNAVYQKELKKKFEN